MKTYAFSCLCQFSCLLACSISNVLLCCYQGNWVMQLTQCLRNCFLPILKPNNFNQVCLFQSHCIIVVVHKQLNMRQLVGYLKERISTISLTSNCYILSVICRSNPRKIQMLQFVNYMTLDRIIRLTWNLFFDQIFFMASDELDLSFRLNNRDHCLFLI